MLLRSVFHLWDSPAMLVGVWTAVAISSAAVMMQHQRMAEASLGSCTSPPTVASLVGAIGGGSIATQKARPSLDNSRMAVVWEHVASQAQNRKEKLMALKVLSHIGENILTHPGETQYLTIWKRNPTYIKTLGHLPSAADAMRALGFSDFRNPDAWQMDGSQGDIWLLESGIAELKRQESILLGLDPHGQ